MVFFHHIFSVFVYTLCYPELYTLFLLILEIFAYIAFADDILCLSCSKSRLLNSVSSISKYFQSLSLNIDICEYLVFNARSMLICLPCSNFSVCCVSELQWLGIHIFLNLLAFRTNIVWDVKKKLKVGYGKIVANCCHYSQKLLALLYSSFCNHSILFLSGISPILKIKELG